MSILRGKRYNAEKRDDGGHGTQKTGYQNDTPKAREKLADQFGVSSATIQRDPKWGKRYNAEKKELGGDRRSMYQNDTLIPTREKLADQFGVSSATIQRDGDFALIQVDFKLK